MTAEKAPHKCEIPGCTRKAGAGMEILVWDLETIQGLYGTPSSVYICRPCAREILRKLPPDSRAGFPRLAREG